MEKQKREIDTLIPDKEVEGFVLKPWSFKKIKALTPTLINCVNILKKAGITLDNIEKKITENAQPIIDVAYEYGPEIIAITLDIKKEDAEELEAGKFLEYLLEIFFMNIALIKNSLSLVERAKSELVTIRH